MLLVALLADGRHSMNLCYDANQVVKAIATAASAAERKNTYRKATPLLEVATAATAEREREREGR